MSPLDRAFAAAQGAQAPADAQARAWALMLESPLCVPVEEEAETLRPLVFPLEAGPVALAFDDDARMAGFFGAPTAYVTLEGRALVAALAGAGLGLGLNLGEDGQGALADAATVAWLAAEAGGAVEEDALAGPLRLAPPVGAEPGLAAALAGRLAAFPGMVAAAHLVRLGRDGEAPALTVLLAPAPAFARGAAALAAALGRIAQPYAPPGEAVGVAVLRPDHPALAAARAQGLDLLDAPTTPAAPPAEKRPPILR